jgi:hypothetical protein
MRLYDADASAVMAEPFLNEHEAKVRAIYEHSLTGETSRRAIEGTSPSSPIRRVRRVGRPSATRAFRPVSSRSDNTAARRRAAGATPTTRATRRSSRDTGVDKNHGPHYEQGPRQQGADEVGKDEHPKYNNRTKRGGKTRYTYHR